MSQNVVFAYVFNKIVPHVHVHIPGSWTKLCANVVMVLASIRHAVDDAVFWLLLSVHCGAFGALLQSQHFASANFG